MVIDDVEEKGADSLRVKKLQVNKREVIGDSLSLHKHVQVSNV